MLTRALEQGASHAYLFSGPPGVGKTEAALAFAAGLACPDGRLRRLRHLPPGPGGAPSRHRDRRSRGELHPQGGDHRDQPPRRLPALRGRAKVYIFLEADNFNIEAANAFLKTLEEPPGHVHFILVTDRPERLLPTIASRCQLVSFSSVAAPAIAADLAEPLRPAPAGGGAPRPSGRRESELCPGAGHVGRRPPSAGRAARPGAGPTAGRTARHRDRPRRGHRQRGGPRSGGGPEIKAELKRALEWAGDARTRKWLEKRSEDKIKRQQRRLRTRRAFSTLTRVFAGWYRDLALVSAGAEDGVLNQDRLGELRAVVRPEGLAGLYPGGGGRPEGGRAAPV